QQVLPALERARHLVRRQLRQHLEAQQRELGERRQAARRELGFVDGGQVVDEAELAARGTCCAPSTPYIRRQQRRRSAPTPSMRSAGMLSMSVRLRASASVRSSAASSNATTTRS
ncbi:MAG: hypothetical protein K8J09_16745, partial [Planctomycetes bacterium]|nr:hypothetical protein [Planctomycetota bacterium]